MEEGINVLVAVTFLSIVVSLVIERIRARFQHLDGDLVNLVALIVGTGLAVAYGLKAASSLGFEGLPPSLDYLGTGFVIAGLSGLIGTRKNAMRAMDPTSSLNAGT